MAASTFIFNNPRVERIVSGPGSIEKLAGEIDEAWRNTRNARDLAVGRQDVLARSDQVRTRSEMRAIFDAGQTAFADGVDCQSGRARARGRHRRAGQRGWRKRHRYRQGRRGFAGRRRLVAALRRALYAAEQERSPAHAGAEAAAYRDPDDTCPAESTVIRRASAKAAKSISSPILNSRRARFFSIPRRRRPRRQDCSQPRE